MRHRRHSRQPADPPAPLSPWALAACFGVALVVFLFFWGTWPLYPVRLLVTLLHESGHALAAKAAGGMVVSVSISPGAGGLTVTQYPPSMLNRVLVSSGGYVGSALAGALLLASAGRMRSGRFVLGALAAWLAMVGVAWVRFVPPQVAGGVANATGFARTDGLFTLTFILGVCGALLLLAWQAPVWMRRIVIVFLATLSCLAALEDVKLLFGFGLAGSFSDADAMAQHTGVPAGVWAGLWMLISFVAIALGFRSMLRASRAAVARTPAGRRRETTARARA